MSTKLLNLLQNTDKEVLLSQDAEYFKKEISTFLQSEGRIESLKKAYFSPESLQKITEEIMFETELGKISKSLDIGIFRMNDENKPTIPVAVLIGGRRFEVYSAKHLLSVILEMEIHKILDVAKVFKSNSRVLHRIKRSWITRRRINSENLTENQKQSAKNLQSQNYNNLAQEGLSDLKRSKAGFKDAFFGSLGKFLTKKSEDKRFESYTEKEGQVAFALSNFNLWKREIEINATQKSDMRLKFSRAWNIWKRNAKEVPLTPEETAIKNSIIGLTMMPLGIAGGAFFGSSSLILGSSKLSALGQIIGRAFITTIPSFIGNVQNRSLNNKVYVDEIEKHISILKSLSGASSTFMSSLVSSLTIGELFKFLAITSRGAGIDVVKNVFNSEFVAKLNSNLSLAYNEIVAGGGEFISYLSEIEIPSLGFISSAEAQTIMNENYQISVDSTTVYQLGKVAEVVSGNFLKEDAKKRIFEHLYEGMILFLIERGDFVKMGELSVNMIASLQAKQLENLAKNNPQAFERFKLQIKADHKFIAQLNDFPTEPKDGAENAAKIAALLSKDTSHLDIDYGKMSIQELETKLEELKIKSYDLFKQGQNENDMSKKAKMFAEETYLLGEKSKIETIIKTKNNEVIETVVEKKLSLSTFAQTKLSEVEANINSLLKDKIALTTAIEKDFGSIKDFKGAVHPGIAALVISVIESRGGKMVDGNLVFNHRTVSPDTIIRNGIPVKVAEDMRAYGAWQIIPKYHFKLLQSITLDPNNAEDRVKFLADPKLQKELHIKVVEDKIKQSYKIRRNTHPVEIFGNIYFGGIGGVINPDATDGAGAPGKKLTTGDYGKIFKIEYLKLSQELGLNVDNLPKISSGETISSTAIFNFDSFKVLSNEKQKAFWFSITNEELRRVAALGYFRKMDAKMLANISQQVAESLDPLMVSRDIMGIGRNEISRQLHIVREVHRLNSEVAKTLFSQQEGYYLKKALEVPFGNTDKQITGDNPKSDTVKTGEKSISAQEKYPNLFTTENGVKKINTAAFSKLGNHKNMFLYSLSEEDIKNNISNSDFWDNLNLENFLNIQVASLPSGEEVDFAEVERIMRSKITNSDQALYLLYKYPKHLDFIFYSDDSTRATQMEKIRLAVDSEDDIVKLEYLKPELWTAENIIKYIKEDRDYWTGLSIENFLKIPENEIVKVGDGLPVFGHGTKTTIITSMKNIMNINTIHYFLAKQEHLKWLLDGTTFEYIETYYGLKMEDGKYIRINQPESNIPAADQVNQQIKTESLQYKEIYIELLNKESLSREDVKNFASIFEKLSSYEAKFFIEKHVKNFKPYEIILFSINLNLTGKVFDKAYLEIDPTARIVVLEMIGDKEFKAKSGITNEVVDKLAGDINNFKDYYYRWRLSTVLTRFPKYYSFAKLNGIIGDGKIYFGEDLFQKQNGLIVLFAVLAGNDKDFITQKEFDGILSKTGLSSKEILAELQKREESGVLSYKAILNKHGLKLPENIEQKIVKDEDTIPEVRKGKEKMKIPEPAQEAPAGKKIEIPIEKIETKTVSKIKIFTEEQWKGIGDTGPEDMEIRENKSISSNLLNILNNEGVNKENRNKFFENLYNKKGLSLANYVIKEYLGKTDFENQVTDEELLKIPEKWREAYREMKNTFDGHEYVQDVEKMRFWKLIPNTGKTPVNPDYKLDPHSIFQIGLEDVGGKVEVGEIKIADDKFRYVETDQIEGDKYDLGQVKYFSGEIDKTLVSKFKVEKVPSVNALFDYVLQNIDHGYPGTNTINTDEAKARLIDTLIEDLQKDANTRTLILDTFGTNDLTKITRKEFDLLKIKELIHFENGKYFQKAINVAAKFDKENSREKMDSSVDAGNSTKFKSMNSYFLKIYSKIPTLPSRFTASDVLMSEEKLKSGEYDANDIGRYVKFEGGIRNSQMIIANVLNLFESDKVTYGSGFSNNFHEQESEIYKTACVKLIENLDSKIWKLANENENFAKLVIDVYGTLDAKKIKSDRVFDMGKFIKLLDYEMEIENETGEKIKTPFLDFVKTETKKEMETVNNFTETDDIDNENEDLMDEKFDMDDYTGFRDILSELVETDENGNTKKLFSQQGAENILQNVKGSESWMQKIAELADEQDVKVSDEFADIMNEIDKIYKESKVEYDEAGTDVKRNKIEKERQSKIKELISEFLSEKKNKLPKVKMSVNDIKDISENVILKPLQIYGSEKIKIAKDIASEKKGVNVEEATIMNVAVVSDINAWDAARIRFPAQ